MDQNGRDTGPGGTSDRHNVARYFTEHRQISWVLLAVVVLWGVYGYLAMPKRKDPEIPVRVATVITPWPGTDAGKIEQLVTRNVESTVAENASVHGADPTTYGIKSLTLPGVSIVFVQLDESITDTEKEFNNINLRLNQLNATLPKGAGPIQFNSGFGDTAALLLTVASPKESAVEVSLRARDIAAAIRAARSGAADGGRASLVVALPRSIDPAVTRRGIDALAGSLRRDGFAEDIRPLQGAGLRRHRHADQGRRRGDPCLSRALPVRDARRRPLPAGRLDPGGDPRSGGDGEAPLSRCAATSTATAISTTSPT